MKLFTSALLALMALGLFSFQHLVYTPQASNAIVSFSMADSSATGTFGDPKGKVVFDINDLSTAAIDVCIKAKTVNTGIAERDHHLVGEDFFDVKKFPEITYKLNSAVKNADGSLSLIGDFAMKGVSKLVVMKGLVITENGQKYLTASLPINRIDYGVGSAEDGVGTKLMVYLKYPLK
jgi:polyisoprenoid-binding protein YceI